MPTLACKRVHYFSQGDEAVFFDWIGRMSCVTKFEGSGDMLYLRVRGSRISDHNLRELLALFYRYRMNMKQLAQFESPRNRTWFSRPGMYWLARVWGGEGPAKKSSKPRLKKQVVAKRVRRTAR
jgi:hypothetical protein